MAGVAIVATGLGLSAGCLDRPITPALPHTSNVFVDQIIQTSIDKIDLLLMIDNSISMADKQAMLETAVPALLGRLITPLCIDSNGNTQQPGANGSCPTGFVQEFKPVNDIHIGIVTSSLGAHGGDTCADAATNPQVDDRAQLLGSVRQGLPSHQNQGFLAWRGQDGGITDPNQLITSFAQHVVAAGETGCGYEASLEAWYRFLIDPDPPMGVALDPASGTTQPTGVNELLKMQRAAFLRPDSLVAIIMLSDENDCSIKDSGQGYLISSQFNPPGGTNPFYMPAGTSQCAINPNDPCCRSCGSGASSCGDPAQDSACIAAAMDRSYDARNLRCYAQQRRFGIDLLYSPRRYVDGLLSREVPGADGTMKENPLYTNLSGVPRDPSLVFLAGIVGVPWQDIATPDTLMTPGELKYMNANELAASGRWDVIVGDVTNFVLPTDPFMIEQPAPRSGANPVTGDAIAPQDSMNPRASPINGHEYHPNPPPMAGEQPKYDDLQYACIYQLPQSRDCTAAAGGCDCEMQDIARNKPLCQPPAGGATGTTQYFAKAYPGLRELEVLRLYAAESPDANSIVASICPKVTEGDTGNPNYGYNPAVGAIIDRLKVFLSGRCLPRALEPDENGIVPCAVVEASKEANCSLPGRAPVSDLIASAVRKQLESTKICIDDCDSYVMCEILPAGKSPDGSVDQGKLQACQQGSETPGDVGYCYIDEARGIGNPDLLKDCPPTERRLLRFIGDNVPAKNALTFIACVGESLNKGTQDAGGGG